MFFSDLAALQKVTAKQHNPLETRYGDHAGDPEIERMLNGSPLIQGWEPTLQTEELYAGDDQDSFNDRFDASGKSSRKRWKEIFGSTSHQAGDPSLLFKEKPVPVRINSIEDVKSTSALTKLIEDSKKSRRKDKNIAGKVKLTVYLPDYSSFKVYASEKMTISDLRNLILQEHADQRLTPPLNYNSPSGYELRMTDGDGEPDRDFPALGLTQRLGELGIDEVCVCEIEGRGGGGGGFGGNSSSRGNSSKRGKPSVDFTFSGSQFGSIPYGRSISNSRATPPPLFGAGAEPLSSTSYMRDRFDEEDEDDDEDDDDDDDRGLSLYESSRNAEPEDRIATIKFPNGHEITLPYDEQSTLKSLLPVIAETNKLLLHSADYVFCVPNSEMKRLKMMFPTVDMNVTIDSLGCQTFELQKRVYADSVVPKVSVPDIVTKSQRERLAAATSSAAATAAGGDNDAAFVFTEATANAYKEWNVVKKNKFGRRQERVFGVDGKTVYNAKRGQLKGNPSGVLNGQRSISAVVKIDILSNDPRTFRITWAEDRDMVNIEYTCDTSRDAQEIVAKVKFLVNKTVRNAIGRASVR